MARATVESARTLAGVRIGELSRRVGVSVDVLRAWERRYGILSPRRSPAGQRLYTPADEDRVRRMRDTIALGYSAQVAAAMAAAHETPAPPQADVAPAATGGRRFALTASLETLGEELRERLLAFDDAGANAKLDALFDGYTLESVVDEVLLPLMRAIGEGWAREEVTVAQEHFASALLMGRLRSLARGWDQGAGARAVLACPPGEQHELGLLCFGLLVRQRGLRISYLGASVPVDALFDVATRLAPELLVVSAVEQERFWNSFEALSELSDLHPLVIGGAGATAAIADQLRARLLPGSPLQAADELAAAVAA